MKYLLAALSGFVLTLGVFVGGAAFAVAYLTAEEVPVHTPGMDSTIVLSTVTKEVNATQQGSNHVKGQPSPKPSLEEQVAETDSTTPSVADLQVSDPVTLSDEHVNWCANRYRSYRREDNSYTPYSGGSRECVSPFSGDKLIKGPAVTAEEAIYIEASAGGFSAGLMSPQHVESCYSRFRSYRPEDNSYQPYGGGPRRQCR